MVAATEITEPVRMFRDLEKAQLIVVNMGGCIDPIKQTHRRPAIIALLDSCQLAADSLSLNWGRGI